MNIADHCPLEKPLILTESDQEPMKPALSPPEKYQTKIANAKSKREAFEAVKEFAISRGLYSNQDILEKGEREKFREMMGRLP